MKSDEQVKCPKCDSTIDVETVCEDEEGAEFFCHGCKHLWDVLFD